MDGEPIASALDAVGQTPLPSRVAVFARDEDLAHRMAAALPGLQGVADTWVVPRYLVDGVPRWSTPYGYPRYDTPAPLDLVHLREFAAMAHCVEASLVDVRNGFLYLQTVSVVPQRPLAPGENHTLVVEAAIEDNSGTAMLGGYRIAFFTAP